MDPLSITASVTTILFNIVRNGKQLAVIYSTYQDAQRTLFMIQTECSVLAAALSQIQAHFSDHGSPGIAALPPTVTQALDMSLTATAMTISVLEEEINTLVTGSALAKTLKKRDKALYVWKEESMNGLLQQLRGQSIALGLLLKALDNSSIDRILAAVESSRSHFTAVESDARTVRDSHRSRKFPQSVSEFSNTGSQSLYDLILDGVVESIQPYEDKSLPNQQRRGITLPLLSRKPVQPAPRMISPKQPPAQEVYQPKVSPEEKSANSKFNDPVVTSQRLPATTSHVSTPPKHVQNAPIAAPINLTPWMVTPYTIEQGVLEMTKSGRVPAAGLALISERGDHTFVKGVRKMGNDTPVGQNDRFMVILASGLMTRIVLARCIDKGSLHWTDTLPELLPDLKPYINPGHEDTTVELLAAHASGITMRLENAEEGALFPYIADKKVGGHDGRRAVVLSYLTKPPNDNPRTTFTWCQANTLILAYIMEVVTGRSIEALIDEELFKPLAMAQSGFGQPGRDRNSSNPIPTQPWPHYGEGQPPQPVPTDPASSWLHRLAAIPALGLHVSMPDMARFCRFLLDNTDTDGAPLLTADSFNRLYQRYENSDCTFGELFQCERDWAKGTVFTCSGNDNGFNMSFWVAREVRKVVFGVTNYHERNGAPDDLVRLCLTF